MKKVMWFSRHEMTADQRAALGNVEIVQVNKTVNSAFELKDEIDAADIIAIVAPINLQQQFLKLAGNKPVIMAVNDRVLVKQEDGSEDKVEFRFVKWERLKKIDVVKEDWNPDMETIETETDSNSFWIIEYNEPCYYSDGYYSWVACDWDVRTARHMQEDGPVIVYTDEQKAVYEKTTDKVDGNKYRWRKLVNAQ